MKTIFYLLFFVFMAFSCSNAETAEDNAQKSRVSKGSTIKYGGILKLAESEKYTSLFPAKILDAPSTKIAAQIHNGLVRFDANDLSILPSIAKDWKVDETQTEYTFNLRNNAYFHDDSCFEGGKGRKITAKDFKYTFELFCRPAFSINYKAIFKNKLKGANSFYDGASKTIEGIKILNDSTLKLTLSAPKNSFIYSLARVTTSVIAEEAYVKYGEELTVGAGPFIYHKPKDINKKLILTYNPNYFLKDEEGNQLPYLDSIVFNFITNKVEELRLFKEDKLSVIHGLPASKIASVISDNIANFNEIPPQTILDRKPEMGVNYYEFNLTRPPFNNKKVRQAFCYAVNKSKISSTILRGQGSIAKHGITPKIPTFNGYNFNLLEGYSHNPERARKLLSEAGYPNGKGFPYTRLEVNSDGGIHSTVASQIINQVNNTLGINIELDQVSFKDKIEHSKYAKSEIFRSGWVADFPSPESFLMICYGAEVPSSIEEPSYPNTMRYKSSEFDSLFNLGRSTIDKDLSYEYFVKAEKILIEDAPLMPLWYNEDYYLSKSEVRNFNYNPMEHYDLAVVYIKTLTREEVIESRKKETHQEGL